MPINELNEDLGSQDHSASLMHPLTQEESRIPTRERMPSESVWVVEEGREGTSSKLRQMEMLAVGYLPSETLVDICIAEPLVDI